MMIWRLAQDYAPITLLAAGRLGIALLQVDTFDPTAIFNLVSEGTTLAIVVWLMLRNEGRMDRKEEFWFQQYQAQQRQIEMNTAATKEAHDASEQVLDEMKAIVRRERERPT